MRAELNGEIVSYGTGSGSAGEDAPGILFVHGAGFDRAVWVMPARFFARHGYRVVVPDLPAHGRSGGAALTSIEAMADWLAALMDTLSMRDVTVVGHSMGSLVTLDLARRHRPRLRQIALLGTAAPMPVGPPLLHAAEASHHAAIEMANTWSHAHGGPLGASANPGTSNFFSGQRWLERMGEGTYFADLSACNAYQAQIDVGNVRTLVIMGEQDKMTPKRAGKAVAAGLENATSVVLGGCGHAMLSERPNEVLDALAEFILE